MTERPKSDLRRSDLRRFVDALRELLGLEPLDNELEPLDNELRGPRGARRAGKPKARRGARR